MNVFSDPLATLASAAIDSATAAANNDVKPDVDTKPVSIKGLYF
jgi:hypothetical protein